jgi:DNA-binding PadR family transcriptional regulator
LLEICLRYILTLTSRYIFLNPSQRYWPVEAIMFDCFFDAIAQGPNAEHPGGRPRHARGRWAFDASFMNGIFGAEGRPRGRWRGGRMFEQGDLRYVVLRLLEEKPRHGYEIIKALEERFNGAYAPSPGVVYPTLQLLDDLGYARVLPGAEGKKVYEITDAGRAYLAENRETVDSIFDRISRLVGHFLDEPMTSVHGAVRRAAKATYVRASDAVADPAALARIVAILDRAAAEIEALGQPAPANPSAPGTSSG